MSSFWGARLRTKREGVAIPESMSAMRGHRLRRAKA